MPRQKPKCDGSEGKRPRTVVDKVWRIDDVSDVRLDKRELAHVVRQHLKITDKQAIRKIYDAILSRVKLYLVYQHNDAIGPLAKDARAILSAGAERAAALRDWFNELDIATAGMLGSTTLKSSEAVGKRTALEVTAHFGTEIQQLCSLLEQAVDRAPKRKAGRRKSENENWLVEQLAMIWEGFTETPFKRTKDQAKDQFVWRTCEVARLGIPRAVISTGVKHSASLKAQDARARSRSSARM